MVWFDTAVFVSESYEYQIFKSNVPLIKTPYGIRKLTPIECFYAQGYPKSYKLPTDMSDARLYKQAGNSVVVPVINRIAENIVKALNTEEN